MRTVPAVKDRTREIKSAQPSTVLIAPLLRASHLRHPTAKFRRFDVIRRGLAGCTDRLPQAKLKEPLGAEMWFTYLLAAVASLAVASTLYCWRLYKDAIRREIATSEVLCVVLLSPPMRGEFQEIAYGRINARYAPGATPSEL